MISHEKLFDNFYNIAQKYKTDLKEERREVFRVVYIELYQYGTLSQ